MRLWIAVLLLPGFALTLRAEVTYTREISRLFQGKCQQCHREGEIGPFSLDSYAAARTWGEDIQRVLREKIMPPWKPEPGHGEFKGSYGLSDEERRTILDWYMAGAPEGDAADLPEPLAPRGEWQNGEPDLIVRMPEVYEVPRRKDVYRCFVVPTGLDADQWLKSVEVLPGNRQVVHHVIIYLDSSGKSDELDAKDEGPGYDCFGGPGEGIPLSPASIGAGWVPGSRPASLPEGIASLLPKTAKLIIQMHYFPGGKQHSDQTKIGFYFAKPEEQIKKRLVYFPLVNTNFRIPPGAKAHEVTAAFTFLPGLTGDAIIMAPHMHLLGKEIEVTKTNSLTRESEHMVLIKDWDFNWQGFYSYKEPVKLKAFDQVRLRCKFDNSLDNPRNPSNPLKEIRWGEGTEDEMCLAILGITLDNQALINLLPFKRTR